MVKKEKLKKIILALGPLVEITKVKDKESPKC